MDSPPLRFKAVGRSHLGRRSHQEDALWPAPEDGLIRRENKELLLLLADGAGGHAAGEVASRMAIQGIQSHYRALRAQAQPPQVALAEAIQAAHQAIRAARAQNPSQGDMATTIVALLLVEGMAYVANVGDSRAYGIQPDGSFRQLSQDHTMIQEQVRLGHLSPAEAAHHPLRNRLSQALGGSERIEIATQEEALHSGQRFLLCSDGLTDVVEDAALAQGLADSAPLAQRADALLAQAIPQASDNLSLVMVDVAALHPSRRQHAPASDAPRAATRARARAGRERPLGAQQVPTWFLSVVMLLLGAMLACAILQVLDGWRGRDLAWPTSQAHAQVASGLPAAPPPVAIAPTPPPLAKVTAILAPTFTPTFPPVNPALMGNAATVIPTATAIVTATPTPVARIVEYWVGPDFIVFESLVGKGANQTSCDWWHWYRPRTYYPGVMLGVAQPSLSEGPNGTDIIVDFQAQATEVRPCGFWRYVELYAEGNGNFRFDQARFTEPTPTRLSNGGWMVPVEWLAGPLAHLKQGGSP